MNGSLMGWVIIGCAVILLLASRLSFLGKGTAVRKESAVDRLREAQTAAMEHGVDRKVLLGDNLSPFAYPGLGLHALSALPSFLDAESGVDGGLTLGSADGGLLVFAHQIVQARYRDGFSSALPQAGVRTKLYGPTPLSFTAGILPDLGASPSGPLALFGHYGPESLLWVETVQRKAGPVFAFGGTIAAQAVLFLMVRDLLLGETTFTYPHVLPGEERLSRNLLPEDWLRLLLILGLLIGVLLKFGGIL